MKECILLHFHVKGVQTLWGSLLAAGCSARYLSILFKIITRQHLNTGCGKRTFFCMWYLLLEGLGSVRSTRAWVTFGRKAQKSGLAGAQGPWREERPRHSIRAAPAQPRGERRWGPAPAGERPRLRSSACADGLVPRCGLCGERSASEGDRGLGLCRTALLLPR